MTSNSCSNSDAESASDLFKLIADGGQNFVKRVEAFQKAKADHDASWERNFHENNNRRTDAIVAAKNMREEAQKFADETRAKAIADAKALKAAAIKTAEDLLKILKV